jgi:hypothetical protein
MLLKMPPEHEVLIAPGVPPSVAPHAPGSSPGADAVEISSACAGKQ